MILDNSFRVSVHLSAQVHRKNKRQGADLLEQQYWLAVSAAYHRQIETSKDWARTKGYLMDF